jgi:hypothetical protein
MRVPAVGVLGVFGVGRGFRRVAGVIVVAMLMLFSGCTVPEPAYVTPPIHIELVSGGLELSWPETASGQSFGYELLSKIDGGAWAPLATPASNSFTFGDVTPRTTYWFKVRSLKAPGAATNPFSDSVSAMYVEPALPVVRISTVGYKPVTSKETYLPGTMTIDPNGSGFAPYSGSMQIKGRGNSTWKLAKKPFKVKLDSKSAILGMPTEKDWVLLANYMDRSQLRTWTAMSMSQQTGLAWTPRCRHVEVIYNGSYNGAYQLCEQVEVSKDRVNITAMDEQDIASPEVTGGYLMELDTRLEENHEPGWRTAHDVPVVVKDPEPPTAEQWDYIKGYIDTFEDRLFSTEYTDPVEGYAPYLDVDAFIDHWILQEVARNGDGFWSSTYFTKERGDDHLRFGPLWDFDRSMGSFWTDKPQPPEGWYARGHGRWTNRLFTDPAFVDAVHQRWAELAPGFAAMAPQIDTLGAELAPAVDNDAARWGYTKQPEDEPAFISNWLTTRIQWMTDAFAAE